MRSNRLEEMLRTIKAEARFTAPLSGRSSFDPQVMEAMEQVPRTAFVPMMDEDHDSGTTQGDA
jgi:hypothetical protein